MSINLGIIGYGGMGEWHHKNSSNIKGMKVVAVYDIDEERVRLAGTNALELFNENLKEYHSLDEFLSDEMINLVLVATPNDTHKDLCLATINSGKNVICEKPATLTVAELDEILAAAETQKVFFTSHQNRRWDKDYNIIKKSIQAGLMGKIFNIDYKLHGGGGIIHGWRAQKEHGGGMILDWGVHIIDQMLDMLPYKLLTIYCQTLNVMNTEVDDFFKLIMTFEGGIIVQVEVGTFCLRDALRTWNIYGDKGAMDITLDGGGIKGGITRIKKLNTQWEAKIVETYAGPTRTFAPLKEEQVEELQLPEVDTKWSEIYSNLKDVIEGKGELIIKPSQIRRVINVMEACFKSAKENVTVEF